MTSRFVGLLLEITPVKINMVSGSNGATPARLKWEKQVQTAMQTREETERFWVLTDIIKKRLHKKL